MPATLKPTELEAVEKRVRWLEQNLAGAGMALARQATEQNRLTRRVEKLEFAVVLVGVSTTVCGLILLVTAFCNPRSRRVTMSAIPTAIDNPAGLHQRYVVLKANGEAVDPLATYFVLRLDHFGRDADHIAACRAGARAYADWVEAHNATHLELTARELRVLVNNLEAAG